MKPNRPHSRSHPKPLDPSGACPHEIVLLEEADLYRYHNRPQTHTSDFEAAAPIAQQYAGGSSQQVPHKTPTACHPSSDHGSEYSQRARQFQLHATPYAHSAAPKTSFTSVDTVPVTHGALRPGGPVDLFSRYYVGLLLNWVLVGFFNGSLSGLTYPFFEDYLGYSDPQVNAAATLIDLPWLFKFAAGFVTDCFPINRQRRKPYILIGWGFFMVFMFAMSFMPEPRPKNNDDGVEVYADAPSQGSKYVIFIIVSSLGHLLATVAVEGTMVEFAQREGEYIRGRTQAWCIIGRFSGEMLGGLTAALALNSPAFGGTFSAAVPLRAYFGFHAVLAALGIAITWFYLQEELATAGNQRLTTHFRRIWSIMQKKTTWQITVFGFLIKLVAAYEIQEHSKVYRKWLGASTFTLSIVGILRDAGYVVASAIFMKFLLNSNWRHLLLSVVGLGLVVMVPVDMITVFDVWRNLPLYLTKIQVTGVLDAFLFILRIAVIIEVTEAGYEAVTYGILTTVFNLTNTIVAMAKNIASSRWKSDVTTLELDTSAVRWHVAHQYLFKYGLRLLGVLLVVKLLPRQKRHLKERNRNGASTLVIPIVLFVLFAALFFMSVTSNMLSLFESSSCLFIAGGKGC